MSPNPVIPDTAVTRLATYLRVLSERQVEGRLHVSSAFIGAAAGVSPDQVRKDLSHFGEFGRPGVGYDLEQLRYHLARILRLDRVRPAVLVGAGSLGSALARYTGFPQRGFRIAAVFDIDPQRVGTKLGELTVEHVDCLSRRVAELGASIGIIAVPRWACQSVVEQLAAAGLQAILNFAPGKVDVPEGVNVRSVDLARELECLAYYLPG
ncbi:MAG: redox-sensing transcriptional repressor Rex [Armatimonadetes bacterium]|nr:redox-sensing transcriptional repressor Rex [Armatimonadota bacterium]